MPGLPTGRTRPDQRSRGLSLIATAPRPHSGVRQRAAADACRTRDRRRPRRCRSSSSARPRARTPASVARRRRYRGRSRSPPAPRTSSFACSSSRRRRLLWRVRRKLIMSYIFIGFVPAILIVAFFLLVRVPAVLQLQLVPGAEPVAARSATSARFLARSDGARDPAGAGRDLGRHHRPRRQGAAVGELAGVSFARRAHGPALCRTPTAVQAAADRRTGDRRPVGARRAAAERAGWLGLRQASPACWRTQRPPQGRQPSGEQTHILVRAVAFPMRRGRLRGDRRPAGRRSSDAAAAPRDRRGAEGRHGRCACRQGRRRCGVWSRPPPLRAETRRRSAEQSSEAFSNTATGRSGEPGTLVVSMQLSIGEIYDRISAQGLVGQNFGQSLLLALSIIGGLFLVIEVVALVAGLALAQVDHRIGPRAVRRHRAGAPGRLHPQDRDSRRRSAGRAGGVVQLDDRQHRGSAAAGGREEAAGGGAAHRARDPDVAAAAGAAADAGLSVTALCVPAREVGGDYYDFFRLDDQRLGVLIADVSGKGTSAALYMAELKGLMLSLSRDPHLAARAADRGQPHHRRHLDARSFITMTYAVVDLRRADDDLRARRPHAADLSCRAPDRATDRSVRVLAPDGLVLGLKIDNGEMFERLLEEETMPLGAATCSCSSPTASPRR